MSLTEQPNVMLRLPALLLPPDCVLSSAVCCVAFYLLCFISIHFISLFFFFLFNMFDIFIELAVLSPLLPTPSCLSGCSSCPHLCLSLLSAMRYKLTEWEPSHTDNHTHICRQSHTHARTHAHTHTHIHMYTHTHIYAGAHTHTHTHTNTASVFCVI